METGPPDRTLKLFPPPLLQLCGLVGKRISSMHQQKKKGGGGEAVKIWQPYKPLEDGIAVQVFS